MSTSYEEKKQKKKQQEDEELEDAEGFRWLSNSLCLAGWLKHLFRAMRKKKGDDWASKHTFQQIKCLALLLFDGENRPTGWTQPDSHMVAGNFVSLFSAALTTICFRVRVTGKLKIYIIYLRYRYPLSVSYLSSIFRCYVIWIVNVWTEWIFFRPE